MCSNAGSLPEGYTFDGSSLPSSVISWFRFCYTSGGRRGAKGARGTSARGRKFLYKKLSNRIYEAVKTIHENYPCSYI